MPTLRKISLEQTMPGAQRSMSVLQPFGTLGGCLQFPPKQQREDRFLIDDLKIANVDGVFQTNDFWYQEIKIRNRPVVFKLDIASAVNTLPVDLLNQLGLKGQLKQTNSMLKSYGGYDWKPMGIVSTTCVLRDKNYKLDFIVVPSADVPLLGIDACINLHLVQRSGKSQSVADIQVTPSLRTEPTPYQDDKTSPRQQKMSNTNTTSTLSPDPLPTSRDEFVQQSDDLFKGLGKFPGEVTLRIEPTIKPRVSQPNRLAQGVVDRAKELINWMVEQQILIPYPEPESWVSKMLFPEKPDKTLRACIDPRLLNEAITTQHCEIPVVRHLIDSVVDDPYFTCLDYTQGFWHCVLDEKSSKACAVTTPFGNYRFKRLP